ncbi:MAG: ATP-binding protein [Christensenellales bacterium]
MYKLKCSGVKMANDYQYVLTTISDIKTVTDHVLSGIEQHMPLNESRRYEVALVLNELLVNCFTHAAPSETEPVLLAASIIDGILSIRVTDNGDGFEYEKKINALERHTDEDGLFRERGRGLMLVKAFSQEIKYNLTGNSVEVTIVL